MRDDQKTKAELLQDLDSLRRRVSELKQASEKFKQYKFMVEAVNDAIFFKDLESRYIIANNKTLEAFGLSREHVIGKNDYEIMPNRAEAKKNIEDDNLVFKTAKLTEITKNMTGTDGKERWFQAIKVPQFDNDGKIIGLIGIARDITEYKKVEDELRQNEEKYQLLFEGTGTDNTVISVDGVYLMMNEKGAERLGGKPEHFIGKSVYDTFPKEAADEYVGRFRHVAESGETRTYEDLVELPMGKRWFLTKICPVNDPDGNIKSIQLISQDITKRKKAEDALEAEQQRLYSLLENLPAFVYLQAPDYSVRFANRYFREHFGDPGEKRCYEVLWGANKPCKPCPTFRVFDTKKPQVWEWDQSPDGRIYEINDYPFSDVDGSPLVLELGVDITEHMKAKQKLYKSEQRFRSLIEATSDWVWEVDQNGIYTYCSPKVKDLLGYEPEEIIGKTPFDLMPPGEAERVAGLFKDIIESRKPFNGLENTNLDKDGRDVALETSGVPIFDEGGNLLGYRGIDRDITERKKAEEQIRKLSSAVEQSIDGIAIGDLEPKLVYVNDAFARMHGYASEEMVGMPVVRLHNKEQMDKYQKGMNQIKTRGSWEGEIGHIRKDGAAFATYMSVTLLKNYEDKPKGILAVARDITESKRREEELNTYRENMVQAEELATVGTLSATLAHELIQPLTVIRLSIQNSLAELKTMSSPGTVVEDLKEGLSEVSSMTSMLDRFRNFARMSTKRTVSEVDLKAVAERIVNLLDEGAWRAKVTLQVEGIDKLPLIYSYERDLEQLFFSLIENAIQAADGKKRRQVIISGAVRDERIELQFSDNCGGIAPENLDRIFEPFFTTKHADERTGLGLCVVQHIANRVGAKIRIKSKLGKGSTFFVTLPTNRGKR